jgi:hypothetical protein
MTNTKRKYRTKSLQRKAQAYRERYSQQLSDLAFWTRIYVEDARSGVLARYWENQAWEKVADVLHGVGTIVLFVEDLAHNRWVLSGREWERLLDAQPSIGSGHRFFLKEGGPLTSAEREQVKQAAEARDEVVIGRYPSGASMKIQLNKLAATRYDGLFGREADRD